MDGAHDYQIMIDTFKAIESSLSENSLVVVHDTGLHYHFYDNQNKTLVARNEPFQHCDQDRKFINWVRDNYPQFSQVNCHTNQTIRHGMTILQKSEKLVEGQRIGPGSYAVPGNEKYGKYEEWGVDR